MNKKECEMRGNNEIHVYSIIIIDRKIIIDEIAIYK